MEKTAILFIVLCVVNLAAQSPSRSIELPCMTKFVSPAYPAKARANRMQGTTVSEVQIRSDGTVESATVLSAHPVFRDYVATALKQWRFEPASRSTSLKVTVAFWLDDCPGTETFGESSVQADLPYNVDVRACQDPIRTNVN